MPAGAAAELAATFKALSDPDPVAIVDRLTTAEAVCVCDLTGRSISRSRRSRIT